MLPAKSSYKTLAKALEPLELEGRLRYLPNFEDCGSCAAARFYGFLETPGEDWGDAEFYVTFNSQTKSRADDSFELWLNIWGFDPRITEEQYRAMESLIAEALASSGFEEIQRPSVEHYGRAAHDPQFKFNTFYRCEEGGIAVRGLFEGKAKPTKAVRSRTKELGLNR